MPAGGAQSILGDGHRTAGAGFAAAPGGTHGAFWRGKTRNQFVAANRIGRKLPVLGDGAGSTIIKALSEQARPLAPTLKRVAPPFRVCRQVGRRWADGSPPSRKKWIDDDCPE
jgi:hypothetical protein